jgi:drug/metabolite transporter (DMT)-like permease
LPKVNLPKQPTPQLWQVAIVLTLGILAVSTSAIWVRLAIETAGRRGAGFSLVLAAARLSLASLLLLPTGLQRLHQDTRLREGTSTGSALSFAIAAGLFLALHFAAWITSLSYTSIAASTTLVTTNPLWVVLLSWVWFRETPTRRTAAGVAIALVGGILIGIGSGDSGGSQPLLGNALALVGSWTVSFYLLVGREAQRRGLSVGGYSIVAYSTAALVLLPLPFAFGVGYTGYPPAVYGYMLLMALLPQLVGHTTINWAVRHVSPTWVTLVILFEPVAASILGYWIFGEVPTVQVWLGAAVLLLGVAIAVVSSEKGTGNREPGT